MGAMHPSRRELLKLGVISGVAVYLAPLGNVARAAALADQPRVPLTVTPAGSNELHGRIDGVAKVTGEKVFARDIRARDMVGWPDQQAHAYTLRVTKADQIYEGFDLSMLDADLKPDRVVTAADLVKDGVSFPEFYGTDMLLPAGKTPAYLGQAVALLIFHDFVPFRFAKARLQFNDKVIQYGKVTGPLVRDPWGGFRFVRVGGAQPDEDDVFSAMKDSPIFPNFADQKPVWPKPAEKGDVFARAMFYADGIDREIASPPAGVTVFERRYVSQSVDTVALEPDNANCWYDAKSQTLHMVLASQSPQEVGREAAKMVHRSRFPLSQIFIYGGDTTGYGSKDHCNVPYYGLTAALYGDGLPVRWACDRFEHFQTSLKRHQFDMHYRLAVDRQTRKFTTLQGECIGNGGGRANFSASVALVSATAAQSIYYLPKSDLIGIAVSSRAVDAGSARGYGTLQSMTAMEMMVDELAEQLGVDPIALRLENVLRSGMKNTQGAIPGGTIRADEILQMAARHPLWTGRAQRKQEYEASHPNTRYGVGFACVQKDFGDGAEACFAKVEVSPTGRIALAHIGVEIGTGTGTSQAVACAKWLGRSADEVRLSVVDWPELPLVTSGDPYMMEQAEQDKLAQNPRWTPRLAAPSSASCSAYFFTHGTQEAARLVFTEGLWPAALAIWSQGIGGGAAAPMVVRREDARWVDGKLTANAMPPLDLPTLAAKAHAMGLVTGAVVHCFNRWEWASAEFPLGDTLQRLPLDGLALRNGAGPFRVIDRRSVNFPAVQRNNAAVTYYTAVGTLVELAVDAQSGVPHLLTHHSFVECGNQLVPNLVSGQLQGGLAMGIGHALYEFLPLYEEGPGNGTWNFNRYHVPRASEVAVWSQTGEVLPPLSDTDPPKGMGEVVMIPVVGAIANALAHATQHRFYELPITSKKIKEALS